MLTKEKVQEHIKTLSDEFTLDELIDHLELIEKIEIALVESERGEVISNEDMKAEIERWSK